MFHVFSCNLQVKWTIWYSDNKIFLYTTTIEKSLSIAKFNLVFKHEYKIYGQYHVDNKYICIILYNHSCVIYIFRKHSSKTGCILHSCNRIGNVSQPYFFSQNDVKLGSFCTSHNLVCPLVYLDLPGTSAHANSLFIG